MLVFQKNITFINILTDWMTNWLNFFNILNWLTVWQTNWLILLLCIRERSCLFVYLKWLLYLVFELNVDFLFLLWLYEWFFFILFGLFFSFFLVIAKSLQKTLLNFKYVYCTIVRRVTAKNYYKNCLFNNLFAKIWIFLFVFYREATNLFFIKICVLVLFLT